MWPIEQVAQIKPHLNDFYYGIDCLFYVLPEAFWFVFVCLVEVHNEYKQKNVIALNISHLKNQSDVYY